MKFIFLKDVNEVLKLFAKETKNIFRDNLIGIYLTGSLSYGGFNPKSSDIDLVAILKKPASRIEIKKIKDLHLRIENQNLKWTKRIECSYVPVDMLQSILPPKTPRPYYGEGTFYLEAPYGNEWLINNYYLYNYGIPLFGPDFKTLIKKQIDIKDIHQASLNDLKSEWEPKITDPNYLNNSHYQSYIVLNLCRILYTVLRYSLASKQISADWVKKEYPQWKNLIQVAEKWQFGKEMKYKKETIEFIKFVINTTKQE